MFAAVAPSVGRTEYTLSVALYAPGECPAPGQEPGKWATVTSAGRVRNWPSETGAEDYMAMLMEEIEMRFVEAS